MYNFLIKVVVQICLKKKTDFEILIFRGDFNLCKPVYVSAH